MMSHWCYLFRFPPPHLCLQWHNQLFRTLCLHVTIDLRALKTTLKFLFLLWFFWMVCSLSWFSSRPSRNRWMNRIFNFWFQDPIRDPYLRFRYWGRIVEGAYLGISGLNFEAMDACRSCCSTTVFVFLSFFLKLAFNMALTYLAWEMSLKIVTFFSFTSHLPEGIC